MPNESSTLPVLPRFGDPDSWAASVATKQDVADAKLAATTGSTTQTSITISGTGGAGFISLPSQSSTPAAPSSGFAMFADSTGRFSWRRASDTFTRTWDATLTANRVYTLPDASITIAGQNLANTFTLAQTFSANGALSAPAVSFTGTPITGGTTTTTKPLVLIETSGATSASWSASGTMLGVNAPSGFVGSVVNFQVNGTSQFLLNSAGTGTFAGSVAVANSASYSWTGRGILTSPAAGAVQLGAADAAAPVAQTLSAQSVVAGTTDTAGVNWVQNGSRGTGTGNGGSIIFQVSSGGSSGSSQNGLSSVLRLIPNPGSSGGYVQFGGAAAGYIYPFTANTTGSVNGGGTGLAFYSTQSATTDETAYAFTGASRTSTSGAAVNLQVVRSFAPTSGTATYTHFQLTPTINQTGGANGITRGLYINPTLTAAADFRALEISDGNVVLPKTVTAGGTTGAQTINKVTGSVNFAAAATSLVVTNSYVTTSSIIVATVATNDTTMKSVAVVAAAGSFTIYANAAATAETRVNFLVTN